MYFERLDGDTETRLLKVVQTEVFSGDSQKTKHN